MSKLQVKVKETKNYLSIEFTVVRLRVPMSSCLALTVRAYMNSDGSMYNVTLQPSASKSFRPIENYRFGSGHPDHINLVTQLMKTRDVNILSPLFDMLVDVGVIQEVPKWCLDFLDNLAKCDEVPSYLVRGTRDAGEYIIAFNPISGRVESMLRERKVPYGWVNDPSVEVPKPKSKFFD